MNDTHRRVSPKQLSVVCTLDALKDLLAEIEAKRPLPSPPRKALERHTRLLIRLFADHLSHCEARCFSASQILNTDEIVGPALDSSTKNLCRRFSNFYKAIHRLPDRFETSSKEWLEVCERFTRCRRTFRASLEKPVNPVDSKSIATAQVLPIE